MKLPLLLSLAFPALSSFACVFFDYTPITFSNDVEKLSLSFFVVKESETNSIDHSYAEYSNALDRISRLQDLKSLHLSFRFSGIDDYEMDLSFLEPLTTLTNLSLQCQCGFGLNPVRVASLKPLENLSLTVLNMSYVDAPSIQDWTPLSKLKGIRIFTAPYKFSSFESVPLSVQWLRARQGRLSSDFDLSRFSSLEALELEEAELGHPFRGEFASLRGFESLKRLAMIDMHGDYGHIINNGLLASCTNLESISIHNCRNHEGLTVYDLSSLGSLPLLKSLFLEDAPLRRVAGLEKCPLVELSLPRCRIRSLDDICDLPLIVSIDVSDTGIDSVDENELLRRFPTLREFQYTDEKGCARFLRIAQGKIVQDGEDDDSGNDCAVDLDSLPSDIESITITNGDRFANLDFSRFTSLKSLVCGKKGSSCSATWKGIESLTQLRVLVLNGCYGDVLKEGRISGCTNLWRICMHSPYESGSAYELSGLDALPLVDLIVENEPISKILGLEGCPLERLELPGSLIASLDDICDLPNVVSIDVTYTGIRSADINEVRRRFPKLRCFLYTDMKGVQQDLFPHNTEQWLREHRMPTPTAYAPTTVAEFVKFMNGATRDYDDDFQIPLKARGVVFECSAATGALVFPASDSGEASVIPCISSADSTFWDILQTHCDRVHCRFKVVSSRRVKIFTEDESATSAFDRWSAVLFSP